jgi:hypothetical protein
MKRTVMTLLVLASVLLGVVGIANAEHSGGIDPFSVRMAKAIKR